MRPVGPALLLAALAPASLFAAAGGAAALERASCGCELSLPDRPNREASHADPSAAGRLVAATDGGQFAAHAAVRPSPALLGRRIAAPAADGTLR
jgi:hypothetical protein